MGRRVNLHLVVTQRSSTERRTKKKLEIGASPPHIYGMTERENIEQNYPHYARLGLYSWRDVNTYLRAQPDKIARFLAGLARLRRGHPFYVCE